MVKVKEMSREQVNVKGKEMSSEQVNVTKSIKEVTFSELEAHWPICGFNELLKSVDGNVGDNITSVRNAENAIRCSIAFLDSGAMLKENAVTQKSMDKRSRAVYLNPAEMFTSVLKHKLMFKAIQNESQILGKKGLLYFELPESTGLFALWDGQGSNLMNEPFHEALKLYFCHL
jgi:hypothetical protein